MAEQDKPAAGPGSGGGHGPDGGDKGAAPAPPRLAVEAQYVKDLSFENPRAPDSLRQTAMPQVQVNVEARARSLGEDRYEVEIHIKGDARAEEQVAFVLDLTYAGLFLVKDAPPEVLEPLLLIECPRLLFPFARRVVADATRDGGFPPLMLGPIDFATLYRQRLSARAQGGQPAADRGGGEG